MNDFLNRLAAERQKTNHEKIWLDWSKAHVGDGHEVWDPSGSSEVTASIRAFLRMVPRGHFETGLILTAPRYLHDTLQSVPGVVRTNDRFVEKERASKEMRSAWQREAVEIGFVRAVRTYYDDGYKCVPKLQGHGIEVIDGSVRWVDRAVCRVEGAEDQVPVIVVGEEPLEGLDPAVEDRHGDHVYGGPPTPHP